MKLSSVVASPLLLLLVALASTESFQPPTDVGPYSKTSRHVVIPQKDPPDPLSYPEVSRSFRRDFYTHELWLKHRSKDRFLQTIIKLFQSGVVVAISQEILFVGAISTFVVLYNALFVVGWSDLSSVYHEPITDYRMPLIWLPTVMFTLSATALSLLLVFKTNTSYARWDEARKAWGVIVNNSRTVIRETTAWLINADIPDDEKCRLARRVADSVWLFPRTLRRHVLQAAEDEESYQKDVREKLQDKDLGEDLIAARHRPTLALYEMSCAINQVPLDTIQRSTIDQAVTQLCDALGANDRIFGSPVPTMYTRAVARLVELWMFFLPLALYKPFEGTWNHIAVVPFAMVLTFFFLGIEELAIQLEEPFSVLPLDKIAGGIALSAEEHYQWMEESLKQKELPPPPPPDPYTVTAQSWDSFQTWNR